MGEVSLVSKCVAEFVGTFLLVLTVGLNVEFNQGVWGGVSIASVLMVSIYAFGGISGANFNPAVSVTLGISAALGGPGMDWKTVGIYCVVQLAAGISAAHAYVGLFGGVINLGPTPAFVHLSGDHDLVSAGVCELLYTFMLCFVVLNCAVSKKTSGNQYFGMAIGFVIIAGAYGAGAVSGGCFNPAVAVGIDFSGAHLGSSTCLAYVAFQLAGAALAAVMFMLVRPGDFGKEGAGAPLLSEFLGTYILVLTVGLNVLGNSPAGAFSIAASLMCMIYALGDISGAHFNPAVTVAILASGMCPDLSPVQAGKYIVTQIIGGVCAGFTYSAIYSGALRPLDSGLGPVGSHSWSEAAVAEIVFTFVLCLVVLCAAVSEKTKTTQMFGLAIGSCVTVGGFAIGGISGGSLNPAVSFGIAAATLKPAAISAAAAYAGLEIVGAGLAAGVTKVTHMDAGEKNEKLKKLLP